MAISSRPAETGPAETGMVLWACWRLMVLGHSGFLNLCLRVNQNLRLGVNCDPHSPLLSSHASDGRIRAARRRAETNLKGEVVECEQCGNPIEPDSAPKRKQW